MPRHNGRDPGTDPGAFLGHVLRDYRTAAGFASQDALAARLGVDRTVLTKAESGERPPTPELLTQYFDQCGVSREQIIELVSDLARHREQPVKPWFKDFRDAEEHAHTIRWWHPVILPGLVQTERYAKEIIAAMESDPESVDRQVAGRMARQTILDRRFPPDLIVVVDETVLRHLVGTREIMHEQISRLAELAERPNIRLLVIPASTGVNAGCVGALAIASIEGRADVLLAEAVEDVTSERKTMVTRAYSIWERVRSDALPQTASLALIREASEIWKA